MSTPDFETRETANPRRAESERFAAPRVIAWTVSPLQIILFSARTMEE
jgi:hypothetical protein